MKIVFVSELFNPNTSIGAVRPYNMATELAQMGHTVYCIVSSNERIDTGISIDTLKVLYVPDGKLGQKRKGYENKVSTPSGPKEGCPVAKAAAKRSAPEAWLRRTAAQLWFMAAEYERYQNAVPICSQIMEQEKVDCLLTSFGPISNLWVGLKMKKKYPKVPWVSDMRDPVDSMHQQLLWRLRGAFLQKKMLRRADKVVTVCDGITDRFKAMLPENARHKVFTITNGYREEPILGEPLADGILRIGYTGQLYSGTRDMSELFRCLHVLEQKQGTELPVEVHHAGPDSGTILEQARKYDCEKYVVAHGSIPKTEALRLQEQCDILCVLTWNTKKEQGVLTGKFFEYLRLRKPILAIITGNLANAELTNRIADLNTGFSYECVRGDADFPKMKQWLETCMEKKKDNLPLIDEINEPLAQSYSYKEIAKQLEKVLCSLV